MGALQGDALAQQLQKQDAAGTLPKDLYNHYTIIGQDSTGYTQQAYATYFPEELAAIEQLFDRWIAGASALLIILWCDCKESRSVSASALVSCCWCVHMQHGVGAGMHCDKADLCLHCLPLSSSVLQY